MRSEPGSFLEIMVLIIFYGELILQRMNILL
jgi:hypothetical protein